MKITLVIHAMGSGGAERVMSIIANYWASYGWQVTLMTFVGPSQPSFYTLDSRINVQQLDIAGSSANAIDAIVNTWQRIRALRAAIIASKPNVVISFMNTANVLTIMACWNSNIPVIVSEHTYPAFADTGKVWKLLMKLTYHRADLVTLLTQDALPFYPTTQGYRSIVMPNPIITPLVEVTTEKLLPSPTLIAIGRLHSVKGFDILIQAFHQIHNKYPDWHLSILGEGSSRPELEELRAKLQLINRVHLPGQVQNVNAHLHQADIFVMSSRSEGFPMALCEAMACGLPVVSSDCPSGPREIIENGVNGVLVVTENVDELANGLDVLMSDPIKRQKLAQAAPQVLKRFGLEQVMVLWKEAIKQVIDRQNR